MGLGRASVHDLVADDVLVPPGFTRSLGVPGNSKA
jgi:L-lactate dehydrogenase (cytochrome)